MVQFASFNISINFDRKRTNTITLENSSRKNNNQGRTLLIKRNKNKKKEKINDESHNIPNTPHSTRRLGDIKTTIFSNTKNPQVNTQNLGDFLHVYHALLYSILPCKRRIVQIFLLIINVHW